MASKMTRRLPGILFSRVFSSFCSAAKILSIPVAITLASSAAHALDTADHSDCSPSDLTADSALAILNGQCENVGSSAEAAAEEYVKNHVDALTCLTTAKDHTVCTQQFDWKTYITETRIQNGGEPSYWDAVLEKASNLEIPELSLSATALPLRKPDFFQWRAPFTKSTADLAIELELLSNTAEINSDSDRSK